MSYIYNIIPFNIMEKMIICNHVIVVSLFVMLQLSVAWYTQVGRSPTSTKNETSGVKPIYPCSSVPPGACYYIILAAYCGYTGQT